MEFIAGLFVGVGFTLAMWLVLAGDREQDMVDDEPATLDTRNHLDE